MITVEQALGAITKRSGIVLPEPAHKDKWVKHAKAMRVHTRGEDPTGVVVMRHNEPEDVYREHLKTYVPATKSAINRSINNLSRILQDSSYNRQFSEPTAAYVDESRFDGYDLYYWILNRVIPAMIEDPNGMLVWIPVGDGTVNPSIKVDVQPYIIDSADIIYSDPETVLVKSPARSQVIGTHGLPVMEGAVYYYLSQNEVVEIRQVGRYADSNYSVTMVYAHNFGELPAIILGGDWHTSGWYESYFSGFLGFGDEAIRQFWDWQSVLVQCAYPTKQLSTVLCSAPGCSGGKIYDKHTDTVSNCQRCHGTGYTILTGPNHALLKPPTENPAIGQQVPDGDILKYISPDVAIIDYSGNAWKTLLAEAEKAIALNYEVSEGSEASGEAKKVDREYLNTFLSKISQNVYDNLLWRSVWIIERYRMLSAAEPPKIHKPTSFRVKTEAELQADLVATLNYGCLGSIQDATIKELTAKRFNGNDVEVKKVDVLLGYDPLYKMTADEKQMLLVNGVITVRQWQINIYAGPAINELIGTRTDQWFLLADMGTIVDELNRLIEPKLTANTPAIDITAGLA